MEWLFKILKFFVVLFVLLVIAAAVVFGIAYNEGRKRAEKANSRLEVAEAMFQERCKRAGVKIYRTIENVEGVFLMKLRPNTVNYSRQFDLDDPYGSDLLGDGYIESFVRGSYGHSTPNKLHPEWPKRIGYLVVEAIDPKDGIRYSYKGRIEEPWLKNKSYLKGYKQFVMDKVRATGNAPRYGVTYDDISTRQEREHWIAGSSLRVVDMQTGEVIAERIGYMMDQGQGATGGGRAPWLYAADHACPSFDRYPGSTIYVPASGMQRRQAQDFVENVIKPKIER